MLDYTDHISTARRMGRRQSTLAEMIVSLLWYVGLMLVGLFIAHVLAVIAFGVTDEQIGTWVHSLLFGV